MKARSYRSHGGASPVGRSTNARKLRESNEPAVARWQRALATRIIILAFKDLRERGGLPRHRESAREFLAGSAMLRYWCHVGSLDLRRITAAARRRWTPAAL
jgi:hypothetical protein